MTDLTGRRIMVVEDLFYLAMDVRAILTKAGAEVIGPFSAPQDALGALSERAPDCALLDVNLGEGASFDVARALKAQAIPFLFFTGYDASVIPAEFETVARLEKPVVAARLVQAIGSCTSG